MPRSDKYGLYRLDIGESIEFLTKEVETIPGYYRVYNRLYVLAAKKGIRLSITKKVGGVNVKRVG